MLSAWSPPVGSLRCLLGGLLLLLLLLLGVSILILLRRSFFHHRGLLSLGHLVSPGLEGVLKGLGVHLALVVISHEGLEDELVRVSAFSGHLLSEHVDHGIHGAGSVDFAQEAVKLGLGHEDTNIVEGAAEIVLVEDSVLVDVHQLEAVLVHLDLVFGEAPLILSLSHADSFCSLESLKV